MIRTDYNLEPQHLKTQLTRFWDLSAEKIAAIGKAHDPSKGSPVFTVQGKYTQRGWTEWTQGFQYGSALLQFDVTGDEALLNDTRQKIVDIMAPHISHTGVHDHGFNNISTYGNLLRLMREKKIPWNEREKDLYELALKISGAVQAARWTKIRTGGFIYSFNGPHSLFVDTIRSCRSLVVSHRLGHIFQGEGDVKIDLLERAIQHMRATAQYNIYYGEGRDAYDIRGRTAHECIFNTNDGNFRCPNSQQGYSGFTTWTRGLAWAITGFAEQIEFLDSSNSELPAPHTKHDVMQFMLAAARATSDFYISQTPADGIPYWDTGAPQLYRLGDYLGEKANPFNDYEPVDSSAAAIAAQGLLRLGMYLRQHGDAKAGESYWHAGLTIARTLFDEPYLSTNRAHQGLILHSVYHRPNGWDYVPAGSKIPNGESSMWGDYHARELALYLQRIIDEGKYYTFFSCVS